MSDEDKVDILLIDNGTNFVPFDQIFNGEEFNVIKASEREEILKKVDGQNLALIILNGTLSEQGDLELVQFIARDETFENIPTIFITPSNEKDVKILLENSCGIVDCVSASVEPAILLNKVNVFVDLYKQKQTVLKRLESPQGLIEELELSNKLKDRFLRMASHDLKSPITAIKSMAGILKDEIEGPVTEGQAYCLKRILSQCGLYG